MLQMTKLMLFLIDRVVGFCLTDSVGNANPELFERQMGQHACVDVADHWPARCHSDVLPRLLCAAFAEIVIILLLSVYDPLRYCVQLNGHFQFNVVACQSCVVF